MRAALALLRACHPEPTAAVTLVVTALAISAGRGLGAAWVGVAVLAGQLSVGWSNDYLDRERDRSTGRADKPLVGRAVAPRVVGAAAVIAVAACVPLSLASGPRAAAAHLAGVAAAWAYNLGAKRTLLSPVPYAVGFGLLPAFVTLGLPGHPWPAWWALATGALLGMGAHFANVLPDLPGDLATGIRGLPHRLGETGSRLLSAGLLVVGTVLLVIAPPGPPGALGTAGLVVVVAVVVAGVAVRARARDGRDGSGYRSRYAFLVAILVAALDVVLLVAQGSRIH
ncbi:MAG: hypothetical protein GEV03_03985 [Streptosporangiales bacterium]|nr:hypothetical protein [Streptosporangiales bacterium]